MFRFLQQGIHKALRLNQTRAPCQKGAQDSEDFESIANVRFHQSRKALTTVAIEQTPLSEPLPERCYDNATSCAQVNKYTPPYRQHKSSSYNSWYLPADVIKGIVIGSSFALFNTVHSYCSGRKGGNTKSKYCPVTQYQNLQRSSVFIKSLTYLLPGSYDTTPGFNVLPKSSQIQPLHSHFISDAKDTESLEDDSASALQRREFERAKSKVNSLSDELSKLDSNFLAADHLLAIQAWQNKEFEKAAGLWERTVHEFATPIAANRLAVCYENGYGVKQDYNKAKHYYMLAISHGSPIAMYNLAMLQMRGLVEETTDSFSLITKSAKLNCAKAQTYLGALHFNNDNKWQAVNYFRQAAHSGDTSSCYYLGICYETGAGVNNSDDVKALEYYMKAAKGGHADAQYNLAVFYEEGYGDVDIDQTEAIYWYKKAANNGSSAAKERLTVLGQMSMTSSLSLPSIEKHFNNTMSDLTDIVRAYSDSQLRKSLPTSDNLKSQFIFTPVSSISSVASSPKFFIPSYDDDDDVNDITDNSWLQDSSSITDSYEDITAGSAIYSSVNQVNRTIISNTCSQDSLYRPDHDGPQIVFA